MIASTDTEPRQVIVTPELSTPCKEAILSITGLGCQADVVPDLIKALEAVSKTTLPDVDNTTEAVSNSLKGIYTKARNSELANSNLAKLVFGNCEVAGIDTSHIKFTVITPSQLRRSPGVSRDGAEILYIREQKKSENNVKTEIAKLPEQDVKPVIDTTEIRAAYFEVIAEIIQQVDSTTDTILKNHQEISKFFGAITGKKKFKYVNNNSGTTVNRTSKQLVNYLSEFIKNPEHFIQSKIVEKYQSIIRIQARAKVATSIGDIIRTELNQFDKIVRSLAHSAITNTEPTTKPTRGKPTTVETIPSTEDNVSSGIIEHFSDIQTNLPWLEEDKSRTLNKYTGPEGTIYFLDARSAVAKNIEKLCTKSSKRRQYDFKRQKMRAIKLGASNNAQGNIYKPNLERNAIPKDFEIYAMKLATHDAPRTFFSIKQLKDISASLPEGVNPDDKVVVILGCSAKSHQEDLIDHFYRVPKKTMRSLHVGSV
ncbi:hypothetical protein IPL85_05435 [Candidatus Saccharibacteria bacterium]|nr:MAG: hypothetical protein IPL85_05435 [Candidatus Saccharibacteria bacterium]